MNFMEMQMNKVDKTSCLDCKQCAVIEKGVEEHSGAKVEPERQKVEEAKQKTMWSKTGQLTIMYGFYRLGRATTMYPVYLSPICPLHPLAEQIFL